MWAACHLPTQTPFVYCFFISPRQPLFLTSSHWLPTSYHHLYGHSFFLFTQLHSSSVMIQPQSMHKLGLQRFSSPAPQVPWGTLHYFPERLGIMEGKESTKAEELKTASEITAAKINEQLIPHPLNRSCLLVSGSVIPVLGSIHNVWVTFGLCLDSSYLGLDLGANTF